MVNNNNPNQNVGLVTMMNVTQGMNEKEHKNKQKNKKRKRSEEDQISAGGGAPSASAGGMKGEGDVGSMGGGDGQCKYEELVITLFKLIGENFIYVYDGDNLFDLLLDLLKAVMVGDEDYYSSRNYFNYYYAHYLNNLVGSPTPSSIGADDSLSFDKFNNSSPLLGSPFSLGDSSNGSALLGPFEGENSKRGQRLFYDDDIVAPTLQKKLEVIDNHILSSLRNVSQFCLISTYSYYYFEG